SRAEHLLWAMARGKSRCLRASKHRPLAIVSALRAPESWPLTFRSEISQGIARQRVGNLWVDQKEKSARQAKRRASSDDHAAHRFCLKQQRSSQSSAKSQLLPLKRCSFMYLMTR